MKKVIGIALVLLVVCAGMASADLTNWTLGIVGSGDNGFIGDRVNLIGTWNTYTDALNTGLAFNGLPPGAEGSAPPSAAGKWVAIRQGTSPTGTVDMRAKFAAAPTTTSKTWTMNIYWYQVNNPGAAPTALTLTITPDIDKNGAAISGANGDLPNVDGALTYFYDFSLNGGAVTTYRAADLAQGLQLQLAPHELAQADTLSVTVRTGTGVPVTPEPGSLLALGSGLVGLAGFAIRRRK